MARSKHQADTLTKMNAKFLAVGSFYMKSRNLFMIVGDLLEGSVEPGAQVIIDIGQGFRLSAPI